MQQLGTLGGRLDETQRTGRRFLSLLLGQGSIGIDHPQGQTQSQGVGKLDPTGHVALIDVVIVRQERAARLGQRGEHLDGIVKFGKESVIHLLLAIIGRSQCSAAETDVGNGSVHVGHAVQGLDFDYRGKGGHSRLAHRLGSSRDALPSRHHLAEGTREHLVIPAAHKTVGAVVHTVAPRSRQAHIARKGIGTQALRHLVVRRQAVARTVIKEDNPVDHL